MIRKVIGYLMVTAVFVGIFIAAVFSIGLTPALLAFGMAIFITALLALGLALIILN